MRSRHKKRRPLQEGSGRPALPDWGGEVSGDDVVEALDVARGAVRDRLESLAGELDHRFGQRRAFRDEAVEGARANSACSCRRSVGSWLRRSSGRCRRPARRCRGSWRAPSGRSTGRRRRRCGRLRRSRRHCRGRCRRALRRPCANAWRRSSLRPAVSVNSFSKPAAAGNAPKPAKALGWKFTVGHSFLGRAVGAALRARGGRRRLARRGPACAWRRRAVFFGSARAGLGGLARCLRDRLGLRFDGLGGGLASAVFGLVGHV